MNALSHISGITVSWSTNFKLADISNGVSGVKSVECDSNLVFTFFITLSYYYSSPPYLLKSIVQ